MQSLTLLLELQSSKKRQESDSLSRVLDRIELLLSSGTMTETFTIDK